jgi:hypothetical protein
VRCRKTAHLDPQMRPACQPPPIRHKKLNHDAIAMARFFSGLLEWTDDWRRRM